MDAANPADESGGMRRYLAVTVRTGQGRDTGDVFTSCVVNSQVGHGNPSVGGGRIPTVPVVSRR